MGKIPTRAEFVTAVKSAGYAGADSLDDIEKWAKAKGHDDFEADGDTFTAKQAWENEGKKRLKLSAAPTPPPQPDADDDKAIEVKIAAAVEDRLKRLGLTKPPDRPGAIDEDRPKVTVKSPQERVWEVYRKAGVKGYDIWPDYETAQAWHDWWRVSFLASPQATATLATSGVLGSQSPGSIKDECTKRWQTFAERKAMATTSLTGGSALVPEIFVPDLTKNVLEYGVARRLAKVTPMPGPELKFPRRTGGMTVYYPQENNAPTQSNPTYDYYSLTSKTGVCLAQVSMQLMQDSGIGLAAELGDEISRAVAQQEDTMLLVGNGGSSHAGITGFTGLITPATSDGGWVVAGGTSSSAHTIAQIHTLMARLPQYARANAIFTVHSQLAPVIFDRLAVSTPGGLTWREFEGLGYTRVFLGRPILENNVMNSTDAGSDGDIDILYGDFARAARFGDHMALQIDFNDSRYWDAVSIGVRGVVRHAITVHDVGSATAAGPVVAFAQS